MKTWQGITSVVTALAIGFSFGPKMPNSPGVAADSNHSWQVVAGHRTAPSFFHEPKGVATDSQGNVYVVDSKNFRIQKISRAGKIAATWGSFGSGPGQFMAPAGVAVDALGNVFVTDGASNRVQQFSPSGQVIATWGGSGLALGHFRVPLGLVADHADNLYVVDGGNRRVQQLSTSGKPLAQLGPFDVGSKADGRFSGVAIDRHNNVYVAANGINELSADGKLLAHWAKGTRFSGIAVDGQDNVYVSDSKVIKKYSAKHTLVANWKFNSTWDSEDCAGSPSATPSIQGIAVDGQGRLYAAASGDNRIHRFAPSGKELAPWGTCNRAKGSLQNPVAVTVDRTGNLYVGDMDNGRVQKFSSTGTPLTSWSSRSNLFADISAYALAVNARQNVVVADYRSDTSSRITESSPAGKRLRSWVAAGIGLALDAKGNMYTATPWDSIKKLSPSGKVLAEWGSQGTGPGQFAFAHDSPVGLAVDRSGSIYVTDTVNKRVQKLSRTGKPLAQWGPFAEPQGLALDATGNIYVSDTGNNAVQELSPTGKPIASWGTTGIGPGEFQGPAGLAFDSHGSLYVADAGNDRIQKLPSPATTPSSTATLTPSPSPSSTPLPSASQPNGPTVWDEAAQAMMSVHQVHMEGTASGKTLVADCDIDYPARLRARVQIAGAETLMVDGEIWARQLTGGSWGRWKAVTGDDAIVVSLGLLELCPQPSVPSFPTWEDSLVKEFSGRIDNQGTATQDGVAVWHLHADNRNTNAPSVFDLYVDKSTLLWIRMQVYTGGKEPSSLDLHYSKYNQPVQIERPLSGS